MRGKLIVFEGTDGSGKATQTRMMAERLEKEGIPYRVIDFPRYGNPFAEPARLYLQGVLGDKPGDVNAYAASVLYAVDRFASYKTTWGDYYNQNGIIVSGRYTTSNAVHQTSKMDEDQWKDFLDWLYDLEYNKVGIPKPDKVIFLDMPIDVSQKLLSGRYKGDESKKDIHESDVNYLDNCRKAAVFTAEFSGWKVVPCAKDNEARTINEISDDILNEVLSVLEEN